MTALQRNSLVEQYLWCIDSVLRQNKALIAGARLEREDVYQSLAVRLIQAVDDFDPGLDASLERHIFSQLQYELLSCRSPRAKYGFQDAPYHLCNIVVSMDALAEDDPYWEVHIAV